jgi:hypothetical protein
MYSCKFAKGDYELSLINDIFKIKNVKHGLGYRLKISEDQPIENLHAAQKIFKRENFRITFYEVESLDVLQIIITDVKNGKCIKMTLLGNNKKPDIMPAILTLLIMVVINIIVFLLNR